MEEIQHRKADHIRICLEEDVQFRCNPHGLDQYYFVHRALPELNYDDIDLSTTFLGKTLKAPILISSMTGGTDRAQALNQRLAQTAQKFGLAMGVGSQRVAIAQSKLRQSFALREWAPDALLFANVGAVQLNYGYGVAEMETAVKMLEADALILHLNPLQECIQPRGDKNFQGLYRKIAHLCDRLSVPVIVKEVGNGIAPAIAQTLWELGVQAIDVAGTGGTSWAKVEGERAETPLQRRLGQTFADWGLPTALCLEEIRHENPHLPLIASGGIRNGLDIGKCLALGADLVGLAFPFLQAADQSEAALDDLVEALQEELKILLFCTGHGQISGLRHSRCLRKQA